MALEGGVDAVMAMPIAASRAAAIGGVKDWHLRQSMLHRDLTARGVSDRSTLPVYP